MPLKKLIKPIVFGSVGVDRHNREVREMHRLGASGADGIVVIVVGPNDVSARFGH